MAQSQLRQIFSEPKLNLPMQYNSETNISVKENNGEQCNVRWWIKVLAAETG